MSETKTTREVLPAAAALIERDGWCQKIPRRDGRRCAVTAIADASPLGAFTPAIGAFARYLGAQCFQRIAVADWNDKPSTTASDVIAALRAAAEGQA